MDLDDEDDDNYGLAFVSPDGSDRGRENSEDGDSDEDSDAESVPDWEAPLPAGHHSGGHREDDGEDDELPPADDREPPAARDPPAEARFVQKPYVTEFGGAAGAKLRQATAGYTKYGKRLPDLHDNLWSPFHSEIDWEIAHWAKLRGSTSSALTDLLNINGLADKLGLSYHNAPELNQIIDDSLPSVRPIFERHELVVGGQSEEFFFQPIIPCVRALWGDPEFAQDLIFAPERHYTDADMTERVFTDVHTGKWWWAAQKVLEAEKPGATIVPLIISTNKTQTTMFRNKSCYPMYASIANIPKDIRSKPSRGAYILVGYFPTTRLEHITNAAAQRRAVANLYHACMRKVLGPLETAGREGIEMSTGLGDVHRCHILYAIFAGDYPEQCLGTGVKVGECPCCPAPLDELGDLTAVYEPRDLAAVLAAMSKADGDVTEFTKACKAAGIKPIFRPFWENLPFANIFLSMTPDILHQLLQGVVKYVVNWVKEAYGPLELDARCRRLPPNHNVRLFLKGITSLSRISGTEHSQICAILLGLIADLPLPGGQSPARLVRAVRAVLDFLYLSQYPIHTSDTLVKLGDALQRFHANKAIFVELGIRQHFNFPKLHNISHEAMYIKLFGTLDNYNTSYTERLHIDLAKDAYRATNRKDEYFQMTLWLERKEKILSHAKLFPDDWRRSNMLGGPPIVLHPRIQMTKFPSVVSVRLDTLADKYGADLFREAFTRYVVTFNNPQFTTRQVQDEAAQLILPFRSVSAFHKVKFWNEDPFGRSSTPDVHNVIHVKPGHTDRRGRLVGGRFDTALVNDGTGAHLGLSGYHIGQVHLVFSLSERAVDDLFPHQKPPKHLAYVKFFSKIPSHPEPNHGMYKVVRPAECVTRIIPLANLRRSIHLFPNFGRVAPREWTSGNVLELCKKFYISPWSDRHAYVTVS
ncbi:hypothetical protein C8F01DRAFT_990238 [Mycena amicta]|nr:hypothetical protein C8F01DRAFT_990238 [Mycena amicta]